MTSPSRPEQPRTPSEEIHEIWESTFDRRKAMQMTESHADLLEYAWAEGFQHGKAQARPEQDEAVRLIAKGSYFVNGECRWCGFTDTEGHEQQCAVTITRAALATPPPVPAYSESDYDSTIVQGYAAAPPPVPAVLDDCPCGHDENEHVHYCSAITEDGDSCNCTQEYARLSHQSEDA